MNFSGKQGAESISSPLEGFHSAPAVPLLVSWSLCRWSLGLVSEGNAIQMGGCPSANWAPGANAETAFLRMGAWPRAFLLLIPPFSFLCWVLDTS